MAFMTGLWNSIVGGSEKEDSWSWISQLYIDSTRKYFSVSEIDQEANVIVFGEAHNISFNKTGGFGLNYTPLSFITCYHIDTRKGLYTYLNNNRFLGYITNNVSKRVTV